MKKNNNLSWLEISKKSITHNIKSIKSLLNKETLFIAITKANAYGHGLVETSRIAAENGADMIGVFSFEEAETLRKNKIKAPILILGYIPLENLGKAVKLNCHITAYNEKTIKKLGSLKKKVQIHIKVETGTNRQGVALDDLPKFLQLISNHPSIQVVGLYSHFANVEDTTDHTFAKTQLNKFKQAIKICAKNDVYPTIKHLSATAAALIFPEAQFDAVRGGIGIYGLWPSPETKVSIKERTIKLNLKPALSWKTIISQIKEIKKSEGIGYGLTEKVKHDSRVAILPVGYWDGYDRGLSRIGEVLVRGTRCKVLGRICMNMTMIDVTHVKNVKIEDEVVLLGKQKKEEITAEEIAGKIGTINYEVVTRINPLLPRYYV